MGVYRGGLSPLEQQSCTLPYGSDPIHSACDPVQLVAETKTENKIKILT